MIIKALFMLLFPLIITVFNIIYKIIPNFSLDYPLSGLSYVLDVASYFLPDNFLPSFFISISTWTITKFTVAIARFIISIIPIINIRGQG